MSGIDEAEVLLHDWQARLQEKVQSTQLLASRVGSATASAQSLSGAVVVTVDSVGVPTAIEIDDERAASWLPGRIAAEILDAMRRAQAALTAVVEEIVARSALNGSEAGLALLADYHRRFPQHAEPEADR